ncbi:MAG: ParA family protein, partial [Caulobacterales bacterium]|nr:ParA family protein [Caulobacterales bacterium]
AANIAAAFRKHGLARRILLIDLDPQFNLSQLFRTQEHLNELQSADQSVVSLFEPSLVSGAIESPALSVAEVSAAVLHDVPAASQLAERLRIYQDDTLHSIDIIYGQTEIVKYVLSRNDLALGLRRQQFLRTVTKFRGDYDVIILDLNPGLSFISQCAVDVMDHIVMPILPNHFSLRGVRLMNELDRYLETPARGPSRSVLINRWPAHPSQMIEAFIDDLIAGAFDESVGPQVGDDVLKARIPLAETLNIGVMGDVRDPLARLTPFRLGNAPGVPGARDALEQAARELMDRVRRHDEDNHAAPVADADTLADADLP